MPTLLNARALLLALLLAALALAGLPATGAGADAEPGSDPATAEGPGELDLDPPGAVTYQNGDAIWVSLDGASPDFAPTPRAAPGGYTLYDPANGINRAYTVRMVTSHPDWVKIDEEVADVIDDIDYVTGGNLVMGSNMADHTTTDGQISVAVRSLSPCGPLSFTGAIGCAAGYTLDGRTRVGNIWICPCLVDDPTVYGTLLHEFGHIMGLDHHFPEHQGQIQVMYPTYALGMDQYRSGDVNGLRKVTANGFGGGTAPTHPPSSVPAPKVEGSFGNLKVNWTAAAAYGLSIDKHQIEVQNMTSMGTTTRDTGSSRAANVSLSGGANYRARVRAHNAKGWGPWSNYSVPDFVEGRCIGSITDVPESSPFCEEITWLLAEDIASGFPDDTFRPGDSVTRQAMAAFLMRDAERLVPGSTAGDWTGPSGFPDVPGDHPFHDEITWLASTGITEGYPDGTFKPGRDINRQAMAAMLMRFTEYLYPGSTAGDWTGPSGFNDVGFIHPFHDEITWLASTGITGGFPDGSFRPEEDITRQAMAAFLFRHDDSFG